MDSTDFTAFLAVADTRSFSRAAERLHLSQPAISKRIASLESRAGRRLFDRVGRRVVLTEAGETLVPYARRVLEHLEDGRRALSQLAGRVAGRLSIGTSHHIGLHRLPSALRRFVARHPGVDLDVQFMDSEVACEAVLQGRLELGIVTLPTRPLAHLHTRRIWPDPLAVMVARKHPLARARRVTLPELARHPAVLPDQRTYTHRIVTAELRKHGVTPDVRLATNYLETLKVLVGIGLGWSVLPESMLDASLRALRVPGLKMQRELGAVWHEQRTLSGPARALLEQLPEAAVSRATPAAAR
ncbi:MAG TPA: LysR family transcriptional regulator [Candidatus Binatia bacterium]|nr:LysR family transcriptional regulator [Candidatus Binatia bacterium]